MYTVKQLSDLAEVSVRTLHYYDEFGLLRPSKVGGNGYRYYDEEGCTALAADFILPRNRVGTGAD